MSQNLFIRVKAETYDEADVPKAWPTLFAAAWPESAPEGSTPARLTAKRLPARSKGVLELVDAFSDYAHYADMPSDSRKSVLAAADKAHALKDELEEALGDRDVKRAHSLCLTIEESLDEAEKLLFSLSAGAGSLSS